MYVNPHFAERDLSVLHDAIEASRFGTLVLCADGPLAAHIPFVLRREEGRLGTLCAHVAHNDPLARRLGSGGEALAIFGGPRAYVSPRWLPQGGLPTYNYVAVHAYGRPRVLDEPEAVLRHLGELVDAHELPRESSWAIAEAAPGQVAGLLAHIVAFELPIDSIQGKRKLSQNRSAENRAGVIAGLRAAGGEQEVAIAELMAGYSYPSDEEQGLVA
jgi:transcriptional regulator